MDPRHYYEVQADHLRTLINTGDATVKEAARKELQRLKEEAEHYAPGVLSSPSATTKRGKAATPAPRTALRPPLKPRRSIIPTGGAA